MLLALPLPAATHYVTIAGIGGEADYEQRFTGTAQEIDKVLRKDLLAGDTVTTLTGEQATKASLKSAFQTVTKQAKPNDVLVVMLIGHGSFDGDAYKINLVGPDLAAPELASMLNALPVKQQLVVNMTSASGASLEPLRRDGRVLIAATKSGTERQATHFARYWAEALRDGAADTDKDETLTAAEAFKYAEAKTKSFYEAQKRLATEHALLDNATNPAAARFPVLKTGAAQLAAAKPEKQKLLQRREEIQRQIDSLKLQKAAMPAEEYQKKMTAALVELAKLQQEIDQ